MDNSLNLAGKITQAFVTSKLTVVFVLLFITSGILAVCMTPREENPQIIKPAVKVIIPLPGAAPEEVERLIVTPLESIISEVVGIDHTFGLAQNSVGVVSVIFKSGQPKELSLVRVYDRILSNLNRFPSEIGTPMIQSVDVDDIPIITITLASDKYEDYELKRLAETMKDKLQSIDGVSVISVSGGRAREISIEIEPEKLNAFGVSYSELGAAFASSNISVPLDPIINQGKIKNVKLEGFYTSRTDIENQIVVVRNSRPVYIKDIATVKDGPPAEINQHSRFSYGPADQKFNMYGMSMPAVTLSIAKKKGVNAVVTAHHVSERVEEMRKNFVPQDINIIVTRDDGKKANDAVNTLMEHLGISIISVSIVLILFLGLREAAIVTISIPIIMLATLLCDYMGGVTINRITLFALIISLGLLVDASIVVIENINRHYNSGDKKEGKTLLTILAVNEIGNATNFATFAIVIVFVSQLIGLTGMPGQYFYPIGFNVPITMIFSIIIAYMIVPWLAQKWLRLGYEGTKNKDHKDNILCFWYLKIISKLQDNPLLRYNFFFAIILMLGCSILQGSWQFIRPSGVSGPQSWLGVNVGFLPKDNKNTFNIVIYMPETAALEETNRLVSDLENLLRKNKYVTNFQAWLGRAGIPDFNALEQGTADRTGNSVAEICVNLIDKHQRSESSISIVREFRKEVAQIQQQHPKSRIRLVEDPPGPPVRSTVLAEIYGQELSGIRNISEQIYEKFRQSYDMVDVSNSEPLDVEEYRIVPNKEKASLSGVSTAGIAQALHIIYGGTIVSRAHLPDEKLPIQVRAYIPRRYEVNPKDFSRAFVDNVAGQHVPLSEVVKVISTKMDRPIMHKNNERVAFVGGELSFSVPTYSVISLNDTLKTIVAPDGKTLKTGNLTLQPQAPNTINGYSVLWDGEMRLTLDSYRDLIGCLVGALLVVFFMLVAYYQSFIIPLIAMLSVPLGVIGIFPGHWLIGMDFTATSLMGIIALAGVVIRSSLLIIDFIRDNCKQGMPLHDAVQQAGAVRLRPIILTALAIILGSVVMVKDPVFSGLGISLIFGTIASTVLTIFVVPIMYQSYAQHFITEFLEQQ